jgi:hypothetical protein
MNNIKLWIARDNFKNLDGRQRTDVRLFFISLINVYLLMGFRLNVMTGKRIYRTRTLFMRFKSIAMLLEMYV